MIEDVAAASGAFVTNTHNQYAAMLCQSAMKNDKCELVGHTCVAGKAIKGKRNKYVLATKFGVVRHADGKGSDVVGTPEHVRSAIEASLKRLQTTYVDLYYQHRIDRKVGIKTTVKELKVCTV